jgi:hypothetical protein
VKINNDLLDNIWDIEQTLQARIRAHNETVTNQAQCGKPKNQQQLEPEEKPDETEEVDENP